MKIIVEGFDGSGKSTVCEELSTTFDLPIIKIGGPPENDIVADRHCANQYAIEEAVLDRCTAISRLCYEPKLTKTHRRSLNYNLKALAQQGCIFIHCIGRGDHIDKDHDTPEFKRFLAEHENRIRANYQKIFSSILHVKYDFERHDIKELLR